MTTDLNKYLAWNKKMDVKTYCKIIKAKKKKNV